MNSLVTLHPPLEGGKFMSTSSAFTYESFPEAHRQGFSCFSHSRVVSSSKLKRMIGVLNVGMLKNTLFLALTVANVIFLFLNLWLL